MSDLARRYARAAVEAAGDLSTVDALVGSVATFSDAYNQSESLRELLANPAFTSDRQATLKWVAEKLGLTNEASRLILLLSENDRVAAVDDIANELRAFADELANRQRVQVTSAVELDATSERRITQAFEKRLQQDVILDVTIDPSILGGLRCQVGDMTIDSSLTTQLAQLRDVLRVEA